MPTQSLPDDLAREAVSARANHSTDSEAAASLGLTRAAFIKRLSIGRKRGFASSRSRTETEDIIFPDLPSSELPPEQLIEQACKRFEGHLNAREARRWMEIKIKSNKPIGVAFVGDPHIDNNGCNWPLLRRDIKILEETEGLYATNLGDITDNWVGRLVRLYADQEMSKKQAWKLAKYLLKDCNIKWLCHIIGNHDAWNDGPYLIKANARPMVPVEDWQSRFQIVFPNDTRVRVHAAHDFPGNSIWNPQHGPQKASMLLEQADIYACGHKHNWAINEGENAQRDFVYWLIRARGYKFIDSYADQLGYGSQKFGATITAIIDPMSEGPKRIRCFPDLEEAAEFLTWKRARA
jgi:hypothetical protein